MTEDRKWNKWGFTLKKTSGDKYNLFFRGRALYGLSLGDLEKLSMSNQRGEGGRR